MVLKTMLVVWLLSIGAGFVNACLVQGGLGPHGLAGLRESPPGGHVPAHAASDAAVGHDGRDTAADACLSFCDSEQGTIPNLKLPAFGDLDADQTALAWVAPPWSTDRRPARGRHPTAQPPPGLPVAIRFLRLTL
jgi:hypothetical protein